MFEVVLKSDFFWVKILQVKPKARTSLQCHQNRAEQWTVIKGKAMVEIQEPEQSMKKFHIKPGGRLEIQPYTIHRVTNESDTTALIILEHAFGAPDEDDIVRYEDDYGRAPRVKNPTA